MRGSIIDRPRSNQPMGYNPSLHHNVRPITHYCVHHNYVYYPYDWTDESSGRSYKTGYYDENGEYYQDVVFRMNGKYKDVICKCEYCDTVSKIDWSEGGALICPQCGGTMTLVSKLDEYTRDPNYDTMQQTAGYVDYADRGSYSDDYGSDYGASSFPNQTVRRIAALLFVIACFLVPALQSVSRSSSSYDDYDGGYVNYGGGYNNGGYNVQSESDPELFGTTVYLRERESGVYELADAYQYDRVMVWNDEEQSYYDTDSELWAWYNTDVEPKLWQYWYEPISGDYGDYGWMEYENGVWYIESRSGNWIPVPEKYDISPLWHIEAQTASTESIDTPRSDLELFGSVISLEEVNPGSFRISEDGTSDKTLTWNEDEQSYYDDSTGQWAWFNTEVEPNLWQYWYEPISGNYEGYGWMEYEVGYWYIEVGEASWMEVPEEYDTSVLWHIE